jgi:hypothetical protein
VPVEQPPASRSDKPAARTRIAADWWPSGQGQYEVRKAGYEARIGELVDAFRSHYLGTGETRADWGEVFKQWVRRQPQFDAAPGGAAAPAAKATGGDWVVRRAREKLAQRGGGS